MNTNSNSFPVHLWQTKSTLLFNSAIDSAIACQECGLCCTGAIFTHINISTEESNLLPKLKTRIKDNELEMTLPCHYFKLNSCSVYLDRPRRCKTYICKLLDELISGEISLADALNTINITKKQIEYLKPKVIEILNKETDNLFIDIETVK